MMKKGFLAIGLLSSIAMFAQYEGRVGVNTTEPSSSLNVKSKTGTTSSTKNLELQNASDTKMVTVLDNGNVGINQEAPSTKLDIYNGTTNGAIKIVDDTQKLGRVLTSDADGVGTWQSATYWTTVSATVTEDTPIGGTATDGTKYPEEVSFNMTTTIPKPGIYMVIFHSFLQNNTGKDQDMAFYTAYYLTPTGGSQKSLGSEETYTFVKNTRRMNVHVPKVLKIEQTGTFEVKIAVKTGFTLTAMKATGSRNRYDLIYLGAL